MEAGPHFSRVFLPGTLLSVDKTVIKPCKRILSLH